MQILGIDAHKKTSTIAVLPSEPNENEPIEIFETKNTNFGDVAEEYAGGMAVIEATSSYFTIHDTLQETMDVIVANPLQLSWISEAAQKTDEIDAVKLAKYLKADLVPKSYVPPKEIRRFREVTRTRHRVTNDKVKWKNEIHSLLDRHGILPEQELFSKQGREFLESLSLDPPGEYLLEQWLETIDQLDEKIDDLDQKIASMGADVPEVRLLLTIPGVGPLRALVIHAEIGEIDRFDEAGALRSYAGMDPTVHQSSGSRKQGSISKQGNPHLREAVVSAAQTAVHTCKDPYLSDYYYRLHGKRNKPKPKARVATGNKLLRSIYYMLTREERYNPNN